MELKNFDKSGQELGADGLKEAEIVKEECCFGGFGMM